MNTPTVEDAIHSLRAALRIEQSQAIVKHLEAVLGAKPGTNGRSKRRGMSRAGRARQAKAVKAYWAAYRKRKASRG